MHHEAACCNGSAVGLCAHSPLVSDRPAGCSGRGRDPGRNRPAAGRDDVAAAGARTQRRSDRHRVGRLQGSRRQLRRDCDVQLRREYDANPHRGGTEGVLRDRHLCRRDILDRRRDQYILCAQLGCHVGAVRAARLRAPDRQRDLYECNLMRRPITMKPREPWAAGAVWCARALLMALLFGPPTPRWGFFPFGASSASALSSSAVGSVTITAPAGLATGDVLIAFVGQNSSGLPIMKTVPAGWTSV